jgi:hypothetical protein
MFSSINTSGNSTSHINVINTAIFVVTVSHLNYLLCAVYKFTKTLGNFSNYGEALTDDYPSKKRTDKLEAEVKKIKTTTSAVLQTVTTTFSDSTVYKFTKTLGVKCSSAGISPANSPRA